MSRATPATGPRGVLADAAGAPLSGMTWDHPRAYLALDAFAAGSGAPEVRWHRQPLSAFEARPVAELARSHDLMVIDHPGLGAAIEADALLPIEEIIGARELDAWLDSAIGSSARSYRLGGRTWAVPIDAAAQVAVRRRGAVVPVPARWEDVPEAAAGHRVALCLAGPHAMLTLLAMCSGEPPADRTRLLDPDAATAALGLLRTVYRMSDQEASLLDPIGVHEAIAAGADGPLWCPLVYGYVSYARGGEGRELAWSDAPGRRGRGPLSVLGGTGLAVSRRARGKADVRAWLTAYMRDDVQTGLVPRSGGQPAHRAVWTGRQDVDAAWGGFYSSTAATLEAAWVRPRLPGWITLQAEGSELVREAVVHGRPAHVAVDRINRDYAVLLRSAGSPYESPTSAESAESPTSAESDKSAEPAKELS
ncbi:carbohydrate ABC transporter substrate-binding protein [Streptomyces formicae]|uniref:Carbohydrate ABC transporter substrate-binding protein n=1 Tax=Streptomyces formicae TaxID=1616117 RepID=A0ABY3WMZ3_9ACTN|nr:carbohydrate ABC transporter substrate-binding protein [Streptomyces formicae]UNM13510.1 carbohydrate ABC transporter substrate-binding protein [Streptomyces formicae]